MPADTELAEVTYHADQARAHLQQRDTAIRLAVTVGGLSYRQVATAAGITHGAVAKIIGREGADNNRW